MEVLSRFSLSLSLSFSLVAIVGTRARTREPISLEIVLYSPVGEGGREEAKRTILLEDIIYAGKGRVATALVAKWGPTLSYILGWWIAAVCTYVSAHSPGPGTHDTRCSLLRVIPICRWHPPRRQQHRGPFRLRSSFPLRASDQQRGELATERRGQPFKAREKNEPAMPMRAYCFAFPRRSARRSRLQTRRDTFVSQCASYLRTLPPRATWQGLLPFCSAETPLSSARRRRSLHRSVESRSGGILEFGIGSNRLEKEKSCTGCVSKH